jgi:A/G-specific adenine glycosylase
MKAVRISVTRSTGASRDAAFRRALRRWYREHGRHDLPWRLTRDAYSVLVSEVMLQQTQVSRVEPYYREWLKRWPTLDSLAAASPGDVIRAWSGLGYNRRGLALHRLAVESVHLGGLPTDTSALRALPGVGPYTASAIQSFALGRRTAVVETNIARVLGRIFMGVAHPRDTSGRDVAAHAISLLPSRKSRDHNLALMDLGATVCSARTPLCGSCPVADWCAWLAAGSPLARRIAEPAPRFETTARFARGRLIDALRTGPRNQADLTALLPAIHRTDCPTYMAALERDGLVVRVGEAAWSLPGNIRAE